MDNCFFSRDFNRNVHTYNERASAVISNNYHIFFGLLCKFFSDEQERQGVVNVHVNVMNWKTSRVWSVYSPSLFLLFVCTQSCLFVRKISFPFFSLSLSSPIAWCLCGANIYLSLSLTFIRFFLWVVVFQLTWIVMVISVIQRYVFLFFFLKSDPRE